MRGAADVGLPAYGVGMVGRYIWVKWMKKTREGRREEVGRLMRLVERMD